MLIRRLSPVTQIITNFWHNHCFLVLVIKMVCNKRLLIGNLKISKEGYYIQAQLNCNEIVMNMVSRQIEGN